MAIEPIYRGQVASSATAIFTAEDPGVLSCALYNTSGSLTETVVFSVTNGDGTYTIARFTMSPNQTAYLKNIVLNTDDILKASTTDASTVDYSLSTVREATEVIALASDGSVKTNTSGTSGNQAITGTLSVSGASTLTGLVTATAGVINGGIDTRAVGASTAAAGTTTADAGVLPAGTAGVYPTTAADGTKGVRINAADQVTGRAIYVGNGVSNQILKIYAPSGGAINGAAGDAAYSTASGKGALIVCLSSAGNTWLALG